MGPIPFLTRLAVRCGGLRPQLTLLRLALEPKATQVAF